MHCNERNGKWTASALDLGKGKPANHILVSIANLIEENHAECIALQEIDRAGNAIDA
jgi:5-hydroxyisourate hydrolase-like protein (transthyretin family)